MNSIVEVLQVGLEPTRSDDRRILSPPCIPIPSLEHVRDTRMKGQERSSKDPRIPQVGCIGQLN